MTTKLTVASSLVCVLALSVLALLLSVPVKAASFDCRKADTATEIAICRDSSLGRLDEQIAELYAGLRSASVSSERSKLLKGQRRFLQNRNSCGGSLSCLRNSYDSRLADLCNRASVKRLAIAETTCHDRKSTIQSAPTQSRAVNVEPCSLSVGKCLIQVGGKKYLDGLCNIGVCLPTEWNRGNSIRIGGGAKSEKHSTKYFADIKVGYDQNMDDADQDTASGFWNGAFADGHSHSPLGTLKKEGECWINSTAKVCGWR